MLRNSSRHRVYYIASTLSGDTVLGCLRHCSVVFISMRILENASGRHFDAMPCHPSLVPDERSTMLYAAEHRTSANKPARSDGPQHRARQRAPVPGTERENQRFADEIEMWLKDKCIGIYYNCKIMNIRDTGASAVRVVSGAFRNESHPAPLCLYPFAAVTTGPSTDFHRCLVALGARGGTQFDFHFSVSISGQCEAMCLASGLPIQNAHTYTHTHWCTRTYDASRF